MYIPSLQSYKNINKIIKVKMADHTQINFSKFATLTMTDRYNKFSSTKRKSKKSHSTLVNPQSKMLYRSIDQSTLPKIQSSKRKMKKGTFLQSWLDEALESADPLNNKDKSAIDGGDFKNLHKYELDKRHLQSQNIAPEIIEKLYNNLYIYSYGISNVFNEVTKFTKGSGNHDLLDNFWKAFVKLMENCTSYQTVYQQVEKKHIQNLISLRHNIEVKEENFIEERKDLKEEINKLIKQLEEKQTKFRKLGNEYQVLESTLRLTDEAFNEEVHLRLKFEEKINAVYTSFLELQTKYQRLVEEMGLKNEATLQFQNRQLQYKNELMIVKVKAEELEHMLKLQSEKVEEREAEIVIKKQELEDIKETFLSRINREDESQTIMEEYISKTKALKIQISENNIVIKGLHTTAKEHEEYIKKLQKMIELGRNENKEVYEKYVETGKKVTQLQEIVFHQDHKITNLNQTIMTKTENICDLERELDHVKNERQTLRKELEISEKNSEARAQVIEKNDILISELKEIKDRYERLNDFNNAEKETFERITGEAAQHLAQSQMDMEKLKVVIDNKNKTISQLENQVQHEKSKSKVKVDTLNSQMEKKSRLIDEINRKMELADSEAKLKADQVKKLTDKVVLLQSEKYKLQIELSAKSKSLKELTSDHDETYQKFRKLAESLQKQTKNKDQLRQQLTTINYILSTKNKEDHVETHHLKNLIQQYKERLRYKEQYVHPMIYEDVKEQIGRAKEIQERAVKEKNRMQSHYRVLQSQRDQKQKQKIQTLKSLQREKETVKEKQAAISKLEQQITEHKNKLTQKQKEISRWEGKARKAEERQNKTKSQLQAEKKQVKDLEGIFEENKKQIQILNGQIATLKAQIEKIKALKKKLKEAEVQTDQIQPQPLSIIKKQTTISVKETKEVECQTQLEMKDEKQEQVEGKGEKKELGSQQKVLKKDFKRALKLTYMRK